MTTFTCTLTRPGADTTETASSDAVSPQQAALFLAGERDLPTGAIVKVATVNGERIFEITAQPSVTYSARDRTVYGDAAEADDTLT